MKDQNNYIRYHRQTILPGFGEQTQQKLLLAKVLVIGAGGLGCPALQYLVAAGIGTIGIVDDDTVSLSNLHRQVLYSVNDIGLPKVMVAAKKLNALNPESNIITYEERLTVENALSIIPSYDIVLDGSDNFATRYLVNDACVLLGKPLVYAAISRYEGQVAVFNVPTSQEERPVNYRDLFPVMPEEGVVQNCAEAGVLGVLAGIIGGMQANEAIKLITDIGKPLVGRILNFNSLTNEMYEINISHHAEAPLKIPKNETEFKQTVYDASCSNEVNTFSISLDFFELINSSKEILILDVRENGELPVITEFDHTKMPLTVLQKTIPEINTDTIVCICQTGKRSAVAAQLLFDTFGNTKKIYSLSGGILAWKEK